ncbi:MAG: type II toxin-antitoxin system RelE/ParE family toxin [Thermodesulfobacteriota bacterium]|nr:type II toxin-antitoxin system RelE/ParE family toxin [Thermodesulfobacteriota bacterium]
MIKSFKHKGLEKLFQSNDKSKVNPGHVLKLCRVLDRLDASLSPLDMNLPGYKLHKLSGDKKNIWSVWISGNWRVTFQFDGVHAVVVDYQDYH